MHKINIIIVIVILLLSFNLKAQERLVNRSRFIPNLTTLIKLNVRSTPEIDDNEIGRLPKGEKVQYLNQRSKEKFELKDEYGRHYEYWYLIKMPNGKPGWVYGAYVRFSHETKELYSSNSKVKDDATGIEEESDVASKTNGMVYIPGGAFLMGGEVCYSLSSWQEKEFFWFARIGGSIDNSNNYATKSWSEHPVYLQGFYMDKYEVMVWEYQKFIYATGRRPPCEWEKQLRFPEHPVVCVSWSDAAQYAAWAGKRLPTEAEWEYAARGGYTGLDGKAKYKYPWGDVLSSNDANYYSQRGNLSLGDLTHLSDERLFNRLETVGNYMPNQYSLYDMAGNVWEWCADWADNDESYYAISSHLTSPEENPQGPQSGHYKIVRGGSYLNDSCTLECAFRFAKDPSYGSFAVGFRCVKDSQ